MKIKIELEVTSRCHGDETMEMIRVELRKHMLSFIMRTIENTPFGVGTSGPGTVNLSNFHVAGEIKLAD